MSQLAPNLFQRRFEDLMEIGRARIPALAPEWTDHNAHDPGITLMELLAWVAEAQLYSLSHLSRDERLAYAALLGITPSGARSATGIIWTDPGDPNSPASTFQRTAVISEQAAIRLVGTVAPAFVPSRKLLWVAGGIDRLETRTGSGKSVDHTTANERSRSPFLPFGETAGRRDVLKMRFVCRDPDGMFGADRRAAMGACWPIGVRVATPVGNAIEPASGYRAARSRLTASLVTVDDRIDLRIVSDTTDGFLATGTILLDLDNVPISPDSFTIEFGANPGFERPPRILHLEPNVIPMEQTTTIEGELKESTGLPDMTFNLENLGLMFADGDEPIAVESSENGGLVKWRRCDALGDEGPGASVFEFDTRKNELSFGNGVNGRVPPSDAQILVTYKVSAGEAGNVARNRKWDVAGFDGEFGVNIDPIAGGAAASDFRQQRREARRRVKQDRALVSAADIEGAARDLSLLEVARAWVVEPDPRVPRTGAVKLVAMRTRQDSDEPDDPPESGRWLNAIRDRLVRRMPMGSHLVVARPQYQDFTIKAEIEVGAGLVPESVRAAIYEQLRSRLALVGREARRPGVSVTKRDVAAWIRLVDGVKTIGSLSLNNSDGKIIESVTVPGGGLPRWKMKASDVNVRRARAGGRNE